MSHCRIEKKRLSRKKSGSTTTFYYKGEKLDKEFRIDLLVEDLIIIEIKAVEELKDIHEVQLVTYLKLADKKLGLLINFNVPLLRNGIRRKINGYI